MCGIVGYIGKKPAGPVLIEALQRVAYRGYDSAGIATLSPEGSIELRRAEGKIDRLAAMVTMNPARGTMGIGHTRWATHGKPVERNAHPHVCGQVAVVHNGIIENFEELKQELEGFGCSFDSDTDTEVVPQLINFYVSHNIDPLPATQAAVSRLSGSFALVIMFSSMPDALIAVRRGRHHHKAIDGVPGKHPACYRKQNLQNKQTSGFEHMAPLNLK